MKRPRSNESGFSMPELLVAMVITAIVSGSIVMMIQVSQRAFRRDPELADRQQNIRMAMDLIMRDLSEAGVGIAPPGSASFVQVFSTTSTAESGGSLNNCAGISSSTPGQGPCFPSTMLPGGQRADDLEMLSNPRGDCGVEKACAYPGSGADLFLQNDGTCVQENDVIVVLMEDGTWTLRAVHRDFGNNGGASEGCPQDPHSAVQFNPNFGPTGINTSPANLCNDEGIGTVDGQNPNNCKPQYITRAQLVTYHIRDCRDGTQQPCLWRRATGNLTTTDANGNTVFVNDFMGAYQMVARGIEDMQVQYATAGAPDNWVDSAPIINKTDAANKDYSKLTIKVRVTLSARTQSKNLEGARRDASNTAGSDWVRGRLTSTAAIRATLNQLTAEDGSPKWQ